MSDWQPLVLNASQLKGLVRELDKERIQALEEAIEAIGDLRWQVVDQYDGRTLAAAVMAVMALKEKQPE